MTTLLMWISRHQALALMPSRLPRRLRMLMCHLQAQELSTIAQGASCASIIDSHSISLLCIGLGSGSLKNALREHL